VTDPRTGAGLRRTSLLELLDLAERRVALEHRFLIQGTVTRFFPPEAGPWGATPAMVEVRLDLLAARPGHQGDADPATNPPEEYVPLPGSLDGRGELVGPYPLLTCPVKWGGTGGMWGPREHLGAGEGGLVHFTDRSLRQWLVSYDGTRPVDPGSSMTRGENLCDAFFEPGARSGPLTVLGAASVPAPGEGAVLGPEDGSAGLAMSPTLASLTTTAPRLVLDGGLEVLVGAAAAAFAARADLTTALFTSLATALSAWAPVHPDGVALKALLAGFLAASKNVAASKAKVE
jgi:hypothetical protein